MKKIILAAALIIGCASIKTASAQVGVSLGVNIGSQPAWGPVGYDYANYYYMPDIDTYYDVPTHQYVYYDNNVWVHRAYLPVRYRNYDLYHGYKVVINERNPWVRHNVYRTRYASYRGRHDQVIIRSSHNPHYANYWRGGSYHNTRSVYAMRRGAFQHGYTRHNFSHAPVSHRFADHRGPVYRSGGHSFANHGHQSHGGGHQFANHGHHH